MCRQVRADKNTCDERKWWECRALEAKRRACSAQAADRA